MEPLSAVFLISAAFVAGAINAVAGGGSLVSFPALVAAGYPSKVSNVTNSVALWPGYVSSSLGYRDEVGRQRARVLALAVPSVLGALSGSALLLATPSDAFDVVVPFLILFASGLMAVQGKLGALVARQGLGAKHDDHIPALLHICVFALAVYGAYFGAGLGIITLAVLGILLPDDIHRSNALKGILSAIINAAAVGYFALFGPVEWVPALMMAAGAVAGGYLGVGAARRVGRDRLRGATIAYGVIAAAVLFIRLG